MTCDVEINALRAQLAQVTAERDAWKDEGKQAARERDDLQEWKRLAMSNPECVHCGSCDTSRTHWEHCEEHPALIERNVLLARVAKLEAVEKAALQIPRGGYEADPVAWARLMVALSALAGGGKGE